MRQGCVDILRLAGYLVLLLFGLRTKGTHVMKTVGNLDEHYADVLADGQQQLTEVLRLLARLVTEHTAADLRQTAHYLRDLLAEQTLDVLYRVVRIFHYVMQQRRTDTRAAQTDLLHAYARDSKRMHDIRFATQTTYTVMRLVCEIERMRDQLHLLSVRSMRIVVQQRLKLALDHQILFRCKLAFLHNNAIWLQRYYKKMTYASICHSFFYFYAIRTVPNRRRSALPYHPHR